MACTNCSTLAEVEYTITNPEKLKRISEMEAWGINEKGKN
jgi:hypothetical protein